MTILRIDIQGKRTQTFSVNTAQCKVPLGEPLEAIASVVLASVHAKPPHRIVQHLLQKGMDTPQIQIPSSAFAKVKKSPTHTLRGREKEMNPHLAQLKQNFDPIMLYSWCEAPLKAQRELVPLGLYRHQIHFHDSSREPGSHNFHKLSPKEKKFASFLAGILLDHSFANLDFYSNAGPSQLLKTLPGPFVFKERLHIFQSLFFSGILQENAWIHPTKALKGPNFCPELFDPETFQRGQDAQVHLPLNYNGRFSKSAHDKLREQQLRPLLKTSL